jgi:hypothetical protein
MDNLRLACAQSTEDVGDQLLPGESKEERHSQCAAWAGVAANADIQYLGLVERVARKPSPCPEQGT